MYFKPHSSVWRTGESPHNNMHASARGLARLAAAMANRGQLEDVKLLSREGWEMMHQVRLSLPFYI